jgi:hypothetical protein
MSYQLKKKATLDESGLVSEFVLRYQFFEPVAGRKR